MVQPGIYRHHKGNEYRVLGIAKHSETLEDMVVYEAMYHNDLSQRWVRPIDSFLETVQVGDETVQRFLFVRAV